MAKIAALLLALLSSAHGFQFIENWLCPKVGGTLLPSISDHLKNQAFYNSRGFGQKPFPNIAKRTEIDSSSICSSLNSYTALGDSYSAGLGARQRLGICGSSSDDPAGTSCTPTGCSKNTGSYGYLFWQQYNVPNFQYFPCSGANSTAVLQDQINSKYFYTPDGKAPEVVSMTVGGDDFDLFVNLVLTCVLNLLPNGTTCADWVQTSKDKLPGIATNLNTLASGLKKRIGSKTKVVMMGYPLPFGSQGSLHSYDDDPFCPWDPNNQADRDGINAVVTGLNSVIAKTAATAGFTYADVSASWAGHRWCDTGSSWFDYSLCNQEKDSAGQNFFNIAFAHPTIEGQMAYLQTMQSALGC